MQNYYYIYLGNTISLKTTFEHLAISNLKTNENCTVYYGSPICIKKNVTTILKNKFSNK